MTIGSEYFRRQAATLLRFAATTSDPSTAAALVKRAAEFKSRDEIIANPLAPDVAHDTPLAPDA
jgi:hypothetical protein